MANHTVDRTLQKQELQALVFQYTEGEVLDYKVIDRTRDPVKDIRLIYLVRLTGDRRVVIKVAYSSFATPERVEAWAALTRQYRQTGIYCPLFLPLRGSKQYHTSFRMGELDLIVWAEEYKAYRTVEEVMEQLSAQGREEEAEAFWRRLEGAEWAVQIAGYLGRAGAASLHGIKPNFPTPRVLFDTFCDDDLCDENLENSILVHEVLSKRSRVDTHLVERIRELHLEKRAQLQPLYAKLPKGMVQGDLSVDNMLVDDELNFAGVIDFNLSGTETIIRYVLEAGFAYPPGALGERWGDPNLLAERDRQLRTFFDAFREYYTLTIAEEETLGLIYNVVRPFTWPMVSELLHFFRRGQFTEVNFRLRWMYRELTRNDIADVLLA